MTDSIDDMVQPRQEEKVSVSHLESAERTTEQNKHLSVSVGTLSRARPGSD